MRELLNRFLARPGIATELLLASLLANVLALASPIFVIHVLNRYVAHGVDTTLATLTAGVLIAVVLEFGFRQVRLRLAQRLGARADHALSTGVFAVLTGAQGGGRRCLLPRHAEGGGDRGGHGCSSRSAPPTWRRSSMCPSPSCSWASCSF